MYMSNSVAFKTDKLKNKTMRNKKKSTQMTTGKKSTNKKKGGRRTIKNKTQSGGWGGFVYGLGVGSILYSWMRGRESIFDNSKKAPN